MMSSTNDEDPFLQVQRDVLAQLSSTRPLFASYLRIRSLASTAPPASGASPSSGGGGPSPELASARADLEGALSSLADDLADLVAAVRAVEADPARFGLQRAEVDRRNRLVQDVGAEVEDMREELARRIGAAAAAMSGRKGRGGGGGGGGMGNAAAAAVAAANGDLPDPNSFAVPDGEGDGEGDDDNYAEFEQRQQLTMIREQDQHLDGVFQTVGNLRRQADDMGRELEEQVEMLDHVDNLADRVGGRLQTGVQKLQYVIRNNEDRLSSCCIYVLIVVLIILLVLLLVL